MLWFHFLLDFSLFLFSFWVWLALIQMLILWWVLWLGNWESTMWVLLLLLLLFLFLLLNNWACGFSFFLSFFLFWYLIFLICFFSLLWFRDNGNIVIILASVACWLDCVMLIVLYVLSIFFFHIACNGINPNSRSIFFISLITWYVVYCLPVCFIWL